MQLWEYAFTTLFDDIFLAQLERQARQLENSNYRMHVNLRVTSDYVFEVNVKITTPIIFAAHFSFYFIRQLLRLSSELANGN